MARIKDKDQRTLIRACAKEFRMSENELLYLMVEMGIGWFVFVNKPKDGKMDFIKNIEKGLDEKSEHAVLADKIGQWFYDRWKAGGEAGKEEEN